MTDIFTSLVTAISHATDAVLDHLIVAIWFLIRGQGSHKDGKISDLSVRALEFALCISNIVNIHTTMYKAEINRGY